MGAGVVFDKLRKLKTHPAAREGLSKYLLNFHNQDALKAHFNTPGKGFFDPEDSVQAVVNPDSVDVIEQTSCPYVTSITTNGTQHFVLGTMRSVTSDFARAKAETTQTYVASTPPEKAIGTPGENGVFKDYRQGVIEGIMKQTTANRAWRQAPNLGLG